LIEWLKNSLIVYLLCSGVYRLFRIVAAAFFRAATAQVAGVCDIGCIDARGALVSES
jgi:hypothetical protein